MAVDDSYTKVLLHMDGTDGSTTFTDESGKSWTRQGDAQIDTSQYKFGGASGLFDGTGDYIETPDSEDFYLSNLDWTFDCWVRYPSLTNSQMIFSQMIDDNNALYFFKNSTQGLGFYFAYLSTVKANIATTNACSFIANTWTHLAVCRSGSTVYIFFNGQSQSVTNYTSIGSNSLDNLSAPFMIGRYASGLYHNGWVDEFRFSKGIARWTSNFTPPTMAYPIISGILTPMWFA